MMIKKIIKVQPKTDSECDERIKELMNDPLVRARCDALDKEGVRYKIIPLIQNNMAI